MTASCPDQLSMLKPTDTDDAPETVARQLRNVELAKAILAIARKRKAAP